MADQISIVEETAAPLGPLNADTARRAALEWLMSRINYEWSTLPPYNERQLKLDRMRTLLTRLGQPDAGLKIVHVAGTKGKGSTSAMLAAMLTAAGYRAGCFSSPHLNRIEERFAVDSVPCSSAEFVTLVERMRPVVQSMDEDDAASGDPVCGPTYFEVTTAMALVHFVERQVDAAVLEVGLGGRLDATNVCLPVVSVITSISFDHTRQLGNTLAAIAREKAGIIKPGVPVVCGVVEAEAQQVIAEIAREHGSRLIQLDVDFNYRYRRSENLGFRIADRGLKALQSEIRNPKSEVASIDFTYGIAGQESQIRGIELRMRGPHQAANAAVALATIAELRHQGWCLSTDAIRRGLSQVELPGRVEYLARQVGDDQIAGDHSRERPAAVIDTAHNQASARALVAALAELPGHGRRTLILSVSSDKDLQAILRELVPHFDRVVATQYQDNPRAVPAEELADLARAAVEAMVRQQTTLRPCEVSALAKPREAWDAVCGSAHEDELVVIAGSFFVAAELRPLVLATQP